MKTFYPLNTTLRATILKDHPEVWDEDGELPYTLLSTLPSRYQPDIIMKYGLDVHIIWQMHRIRTGNDLKEYYKIVKAGLEVYGIILSHEYTISEMTYANNMNSKEDAFLWLLVAPEVSCTSHDWENNLRLPEGTLDGIHISYYHYDGRHLLLEYSEPIGDYNYNPREEWLH